MKRKLHCHSMCKWDGSTLFGMSSEYKKGMVSERQDCSVVSILDRESKDLGFTPRPG